MFHIMQARKWEKMSLTREQIMKSWRLAAEHCVVCFVCERYLLVFILLCGFFPLGFPTEVFSMQVCGPTC